MGADISFVCKEELVVCSSVVNFGIGVCFLVDVSVCIFMKDIVEETKAAFVERVDLVSSLDIVSNLKEALLVTPE